MPDQLRITGILREERVHEWNCHRRLAELRQLRHDLGRKRLIGWLEFQYLDERSDRILRICLILVRQVRELICRGLFRIELADLVHVLQDRIRLSFRRLKCARKTEASQSSVGVLEDPCSRGGDGSSGPRSASYCSST